MSKDNKPTHDPQDIRSFLSNTFLTEKNQANTEESETAPLSKAENKISAITDQTTSLSTMINFISEGIFVVNNEGVIEMINPVAAKLFAADRETLIGQKWIDYLSNHNKEEYQCLFNNLKDNKDVPLTHGPKEIILNRADGSSLEADLSLSCFPYMQAETNPLFIGVLHDLTSHKADYGKLRRLARTDHLTGLANRHAFEEALHTSWSECVGTEQPLSVVIIDVDYFKQFNDQHGHINGDKCLKKIADTISECLPSRDCVAARYGGEEFALIMPRCHIQIAQVVAIRIKLQINALRFYDQGLMPSVKVTVSQGIACERRGLYRTPEALLSSADTALYRAKSNGRNQINLGQ